MSADAYRGLARLDNTRQGRAYVRLGTTEDGGYVVVGTALRVTPGKWQTVTHGTVENPLCLSFMGQVYEKGARRGYPSHAGQIQDALDAITVPAPGWTLDEVAEVHRIWNDWHLNTLNAACVHQTEPSQGDDPEPCPVTGYRYGHGWLVNPLPDAVVERVAYLFRDRTHEQYVARGYDAAGNVYPNPTQKEDDA